MRSMFMYLTFRIVAGAKFILLEICLSNLHFSSEIQTSILAWLAFLPHSKNNHF